MDKLIVTQLVKFPVFYGIRRLITTGPNSEILCNISWGEELLASCPILKLEDHFFT